MRDVWRMRMKFPSPRLYVASTTDAVGGGHHRRSDRRAVIDAVMRTEVVEQRMEAVFENLR
jgi:hypothetical protein